MKRPLLTALGLFLLGELAGQWIDRNLWYSGGAALGAAGIVTGIIKNEKETERNNRLSAVKKKAQQPVVSFVFCPWVCRYVCGAATSC